MPSSLLAHARRALAAPLALTIALMAAPQAGAEVMAFRQAVAEGAAREEALAEHYRQTRQAPLWTGAGDLHAARRAALLEALERAGDHGLPVEAYDPAGLRARMAAARSPRERGAVEVALSRAFLAYARDLDTGVLVPSRADGDIKREVPRREATAYLDELSRAENPRALLRGLAPRSPEYARLMKAKLMLERVVAAGGWGARVPADKLEPGQSGTAVVALRDRLMARGYLRRSAAASYDATLQKAVQAFQVDHGLEPDGVAGPATLAALNVPAEERLKSVIVAMERERWLPEERGARHILVNLTDFSSRILDDGKETFRTRSVIGHTDIDRRTPEFSDVMDHMVINPSWNVPRSITVKEYLPNMQRNRNAHSYLRVIDSRGRVVSRSAVNFGAYSARSFPYRLQQPPSTRNALGLVKFMFPNKYNIYLHDTPQKHLFERETRAYSHGCIRLAEPFDFAYALLAPQTDDPRGTFHRILDTGRETRVNLEPAVPVHLIYRTAFTTAKGRVEYRDDIYGRDARIWAALKAEGVVLTAARG
ncbi:MAG: murein L,D-transpeptidase [Paracoccaceae bacterium]